MKLDLDSLQSIESILYSLCCTKVWSLEPILELLTVSLDFQNSVTDTEIEISIYGFTEPISELVFPELILETVSVPLEVNGLAGIWFIVEKW